MLCRLNGILKKSDNKNNLLKDIDFLSHFEKIVLSI